MFRSRNPSPGSSIIVDLRGHPAVTAYANNNANTSTVHGGSGGSSSSSSAAHPVLAAEAEAGCGGVGAAAKQYVQVGVIAMRMALRLNPQLCSIVFTDSYSRSSELKSGASSSVAAS